MTDPYQVLGVSRDASEEEIKEAYKALARKYHPDNYANSPLADVATEKMQEVNAAYDQIMAERRTGRTTGGSTGNPFSGGSAEYADIRRLIQQNRQVEAEELLDGIPANRRSAEWHFLKGTIYYNRGWLDNAQQEIARACQIDPNNPEYRAALNQMMWQRGGGFGAPGQMHYRTGPAGGMNACDCCSSLLCADCCCECMGGDLIPCC